ncbi:MAG TPA: hypothetical protein VM008_19045 [Phycisphaerae bacterium]|nr:hypothetical protein [Phycisphaerae bacterium]
MFGGAYYIWIMAGFFLLAVGVIGLFALILWVGHLIEKKETGATHGFLELPDELRGEAKGDVKHEDTKPPPGTKDHEEGTADKHG